MNIRPLIGFDNLLLGTSKEATMDILGPPDEISTEEYPGGFKSEEWRYDYKQIDLSFDSGSNFALSAITLSNPATKLDGLSIIGISTTELLEKFPSIFLEEDFEETGQNFVMPKTELSFWVARNQVENVTIFPEYEEDNETIKWPNVS